MAGKKAKSTAKSDTDKKGRLLEQIAANIYRATDLDVKIRVQLPVLGDDDRTREIDVLATGEVAGMPIQIPMECKNEGKPIGEEYIDAFVGKLSDVGLSPRQSIYVSANGYTKDALRRASKAGIKVLKLEGLTPDRLASAVTEVAQSIIYLLLTVLSARPLETVEGLSNELPAFCTKEGVYIGTVPDLIWRLWVTSQLDLILGAKAITIRFGEPLYFIGHGDTAQGITGLTVDVIVRGHILTIPGEARTHSLIDAGSGAIERQQVRATFQSAPGVYTLRTVASEGELIDLMKERRSNHLIVSRVRLPRVQIGPCYWPPSERVRQTITERLQAFEMHQGPDPRPFSFGELEGTDVTIAWEPPMADYGQPSLPPVKTLQVEVAVEPAAAVKEYEALLQSRKANEDELTRGWRIGQDALALMRAIGDQFGQAQALAHLGTVARQSGRWQEALSYFDQSLALRQTIADGLGQARVYLEKAYVFQWQGDWEAAEGCCLTALELIGEAGNRAVQAQALQVLGDVLMLRGEWQQADERLIQSLCIRQELEDRAGEVQSLISLGNLYQRHGRWDDARQRFEEAYRFAQSNSDHAMEALALMNLGNVSLQQGLLDAAEEQYHKSLAMARQLRDRYREGQVLGNLGDVYGRRGDWPAARQAYEQSLQICQELGDRAGEGTALNKLGHLCVEYGDTESAQDYCIQSLAIRQELGDGYGEAFTLSALGGIALEQGRLDEAAAYFDRSTALRQALHDPHGVAESQLHLGQVSLAREDWSGAVPKLGEALNAFQKLGDPYFEALALLGLGDAAYGRQEFEAAATAWNEALARMPADMWEREVINERLTLCSQACGDGDTGGQSSGGVDDESVGSGVPNA